MNLCSGKFANMFQILLKHLPSFMESLSNKKDTETNALNLTTNFTKSNDKTNFVKALLGN